MWRADTFNCAQKLLQKLLQKGVAKSDQIAVLSMASDYLSGGGSLKNSSAQEESLCKRSNLYLSLTKSLGSETFYPMKADQLLYTPGVTVFREDQTDDYEWYKSKDYFAVNVISAAAIRHPKLTMDEEHYAKVSDRTLMETKVRAVLRIAYQKGNKVLVLGAWGAGAFGHSPQASSAVFKTVLFEEEFINVFDMIIDSKSTNNCATFKATFPINQ